jgi:ribosomal protein S16
VTLHQLSSHAESVAHHTASTLVECQHAGKDGNKHVGLNIARVQYWLSVGAQPSKTVARILGQAAIIPQPPPPQSRQLGPKKELKQKK